MRHSELSSLSFATRSCGSLELLIRYSNWPSLGQLLGHLICPARGVTITDSGLQKYGLTEFEFVGGHSQAGFRFLRLALFTVGSNLGFEAGNFRPALAGFSFASLNLKILCRRFTFVGDFLVFDNLPLVQTAKSCFLNRRDVNEHVFTAATLWLNESITLGRVEPLHGACRHFCLLKSAHKCACRRATIAWLQIRIPRCLQKVPSGACIKQGQSFE
jgi:hypothetical protein